MYVCYVIICYVLHTSKCKYRMVKTLVVGVFFNMAVVEAIGIMS